MARRLKRGDTVIVITGKDKGKSGKVIEVLKGKDTVLVEGVNKCKKHEKPNPKNEQGGIVEREVPVHVSNVKLAEAQASASKESK
jgi:large subunit ribosomal protein L24